MLLIILRPSLIRILLGWDLLRLVPHYLVIYYRSYNTGIVMILSNRIGNVGLSVTIGLLFIINFNSFKLDQFFN